MSHEATRASDFSWISHKPVPGTAVRILTDHEDDSVHPETLVAYGTTESLMADTKTEHDVDDERHPAHVSFWSRCRSRWTRLRLDTWLHELLSLAISFICLVALVILLSEYDQKPLRDWKLGITLNAVISIIVTIMDAALALPLASGFGQLEWILLKRDRQSLQKVQKLDDASRSTMGSLTFLMSYHGSVIGSVGAVLAVLTLAIGPFAQQVVDISFKDVITGQASTGRALNGTEMLLDEMGNGEYDGAGTMALPMRAAYYNALFGFSTNGRLPDPSFTCPSGNCTWDPFVSLAICSECHDLADLVQRTEWDFVSNDSYNTNTSLVSWALPSKYNSLNISFPVDTQYSDTLDDYMVLEECMNVTSIWEDAEYERHTLEDSFLTLALLNGSARHSREVTVQECSLRICLNEVEASVQNGNYTEIRTEVAKTVPVSFSPVVIEGHSGSVPGVEGYLVPSDSKWEGTPYTTMSFFVWQLQQMIGATFNGSARKFRYELSGLSDNQRSFESEAMLAIWEGADFPAQLEYITRSMSTHMREPNSGGSDIISGASYTTDAYYTVRWPWLILPVAVVVLVATFSLVLMYETRRTETRLWKNSMLAMLFHGLDDDARKQLVAEHTSGRLEKASQMDDFAETIQVNLGLNETHGAEEIFVMSNVSK